MLFIYYLGVAEPIKDDGIYNMVDPYDLFLFKSLLSSAVIRCNFIFVLFKTNGKPYSQTANCVLKHYFLLLNIVILNHALNRLFFKNSFRIQKYGNCIAQQKLFSNPSKRSITIKRSKFHDA